MRSSAGGSTGTGVTAQADARGLRSPMMRAWFLHLGDPKRGEMGIHGEIFMPLNQKHEKTLRKWLG